MATNISEEKPTKQHAMENWLMTPDATHLISVTFIDPDDGNERVAYVEDGVIPEKSMLLSEFKTDFAKKHPDTELLVLPPDKAMARIEANEAAQFIKPWEEISQEDYDKFLEGSIMEKPEYAFGVHLWRNGEYFTSNITAHYAVIPEKSGINNDNRPRYYTAMRRTSQEYSALAEEVTHTYLDSINKETERPRRPYGCPLDLAQELLGSDRAAKDLLFRAVQKNVEENHHGQFVTYSHEFCNWMEDNGYSEHLNKEVTAGMPRSHDNYLHDDDIEPLRNWLINEGFPKIGINLEANRAPELDV